jgi:hypothetical protein
MSGSYVDVYFNNTHKLNSKFLTIQNDINVVSIHYNIVIPSGFFCFFIFH